MIAVFVSKHFEAVVTELREAASSSASRLLLLLLYVLPRGAQGGPPSPLHGSTTPLTV